MLHWETGVDKDGRLIWLRFVTCSHWGMILTGWLPHYAWPPLRRDQFWAIGSNG